MPGGYLGRESRVNIKPLGISLRAMATRPTSAARARLDRGERAREGGVWRRRYREGEGENVREREIARRGQRASKVCLIRPRIDDKARS